MISSPLSFGQMAAVLTSKFRTDTKYPGQRPGALLLTPTGPDNQGNVILNTVL